VWGCSYEDSKSNCEMQARWNQCEWDTTMTSCHVQGAYVHSIMTSHMFLCADAKACAASRHRGSCLWHCATGRPWAAPSSARAREQLAIDHPAGPGPVLLWTAALTGGPPPQVTDYIMCSMQRKNDDCSNTFGCRISNATGMDGKPLRWGARAGGAWAVCGWLARASWAGTCCLGPARVVQGQAMGALQPGPAAAARHLAAAQA
jgi:hypothetical protein